LIARISARRTPRGTIELQREAAMTIIALALAQAVNRQVRDRFAKGFKSSNKVYHHPVTEADAIDLKELSHLDWSKLTPDALRMPTQYSDPSRMRVLKLYEKYGFRVDLSERYRRRNINAMGATSWRRKVPEDELSSQTAAALGQKSEAELAGNCLEMARYAAKLVNDTIGEAKGLTYLGSLTPPPADHVFCIVARNPPWRVLPIVAQFPSLNNSSDWVVVDPWLNVCCAANTYPSEVDRQLQKWKDSGKRILWNGKFHLPTGTYKQKFMLSQVQFKKYE
jgi:hypothetical protein